MIVQEMKPYLYVCCPTSLRGAIQRSLAGSQATGCWVNDAAQALAALERQDGPLLMDMACEQSLTWISRIRAEKPSTVVIALTDDEQLATGARRSGATAVLRRDFRAPDLVRLLGQLQRPKPSGNGGAGHRSNGIVADSPAMRRVLDLVEVAGQRCCGLTICGEPATGREMVARAVHHRTRPSARFVTVDCSGSCAHTLEAELFGHQSIRLVPTGNGAHAALGGFSRSSKLNQALGGTLFIRRLVDMPAAVQRKLARLHRDAQGLLMETGEEVPFDVQLIAAVEPTFETALEHGGLEPDLYQRLKFLRIDVPPLRQRREDLPGLARHLLQEICDERRTAVKTLDDAAAALLSALPWQGNVRELRSVLETLVKIASGSNIRLQDVLTAVRLDAAMPAMAAGMTLREARARFEREYISAVIERHRGRMGEAAEALGIQRTNLYRKIRELKVTRQRKMSA